MSSLTKALVVLLDELVFRPLVWLVNWKPGSARPNARLEDFWFEED